MNSGMPTVGFVSFTHGRPAITLDRARAEQYASDSNGTIDELVTRTAANAAFDEVLHKLRAVIEGLGIPNQSDAAINLSVPALVNITRLYAQEFAA